MMLSKSQYIRGLQCHKSLWLYKNKPELREKPDAQTKSILNMGNLVGDFATKLFPGGVEIEFDPKDFDGMIQRTRELIDQGVETIYEAAFKEKGIFAMADILHKGESGWEIYEVKASTEVKPYHINDATIQWHALSNVLDLSKVAIVHINNQYVRDGELEVDKLFTIEDVTEQIISNQAYVEQNLSNMEVMLSGDIPNIDIGLHCSDPHDCDFHNHCWAAIPDTSVFNLYRMNKKKKFELYQNGVIELNDISIDFDLSDKQQIQVMTSRNNEVFVDKEIIHNFLDKLVYPLSFFDFETFQDAIPRFDGQRTYMQVPFQYSLHILDDSGAMIHKEFLGDEQSDPRKALCEQMIADIPSTGTILAFNMSFEKSRIKELARDFPEYSEQLLPLNDRFEDLIEPFRDEGYYDPKFNGSFSIKSVLPAMIPDDPSLDYKSLNIQNGGMAMDTFANLHQIEDPTEVETIREDLLAYCHLDTLAMVKIWEKLSTIVADKLGD